jgi:hypothetical protein
MATVVSQRANPPYLLILFVFLFLVSTALAVLFYLESDKAGESLQQCRGQLDALASEPQRNAPQFKALRESADATGQSLYGYLVQTRNQLVEFVTGEATQTFEVAAAQTRLARELAGTEAGLVAAVRALHEKAGGLSEQIEQHKARIQQLQGEIQQGEQKLQEATAGLKEQLQQCQDALAAAEQKLQQASEQIEQRAAAIESEYNEKISELNQTITENADTIRSQEGQIAQLNQQIAGLKSMLTRDRIETPFRREAGRIERIIEENEICYIDIGQKDQVIPGMTFSVYPAEGYEQEDALKGRIRVLSTGPRTSTCKIVDTRRGEVLLPGDRVENPMWNPDRPLQFVIAGAFDFTRPGRPTAEDRQALIAMIERHGGTVQDEVTLQTDFVVLGLEPDRPSPPSEDESAQARAIREARLEAYQRYQQVRRRAAELGVTLLNQNRFLTLTGQMMPR